MWKVSIVNGGSGMRDGNLVYANDVWSVTLLEEDHLHSLSLQHLCPRSIVTCARVWA
jgi:hypothetical protein